LKVEGGGFQLRAGHRLGQAKRFVREVTAGVKRSARLLYQMAIERYL